MLQEQEIIGHCQRGKLKEFSHLYDAYVKKIYRFCYYKTCHKETAEDLTSQTFIKALEGIKRFNSKKGTFQAWLFKIARNNVVDYYRTKKRLVRVEDVWDLKSGCDIPRDAHTKQLAAKAKEELSKLPVEQREIVLLRVWDKMTYQELAQIVGKSPAACKMAFLRAIKRLKESLPLAAILFLITVLSS